MCICSFAFAKKIEYPVADAALLGFLTFSGKPHPELFFWETTYQSEGNPNKDDMHFSISSRKNVFIELCKNAKQKFSLNCKNVVFA